MKNKLDVSISSYCFSVPLVSREICAVHDLMNIFIRRFLIRFAGILVSCPSGFKKYQTSFC